MALTAIWVVLANDDWDGWHCSCGGGALPRQDGAEPRHHTIKQSKLFGYCFLVDHNLQMRGHVFVQLHWDNELADRF